MRLADGRRRLADRAHPARNLAGRAVRILPGHDRRRPGPRVARARHRLHRGQQVELLPGRRAQRQRPRIHTHNQLPARLRHVANAASGRIPAIRQNVIAGADRKLRQRFSRAGPLGPRQLEEVARQRRQTDAVVQAPQRPARPRFLHRRRIHRTDPECALGDDRQVALPEQPDTQRAQPLAGFLQALQQRHVGQIRQLRLPGAHRRLPQRVPAAEVQQQGPQEVVHRLVLAQPLQRSGVPRQLLPVRGQERQQHVPILAARADLRVVHPARQGTPNRSQKTS